MSRLCDSCASLGLAAHDFTDFAIGAKGTNEEVIKQQFLGVLKNNITCPLCQLIALAVEDTRREWEREHVSDDSVRCRISLMPYRFPTPKPFKVLDVRTQFPFNGPSYGIQLLPVGLGDPQGPLIGRILDPSKVSLPQIQIWMLNCVEDHGDSCSLSKSPRFKEIQDVMLVIDVELDCVVRPTGEYQYMVLSYVWGKTNTVFLLKENIATLQHPGSIAEISENLPSTIQDAIKLTKDLGQKYIWIDSLCIIQDDAEFKSKIINKMNLVYENAFVTIIAASGSDANSGLPGVRTSTRNFTQPVAEINENLKLLYARSHQTLAESVWAARGWTYQEYYFSKRRLIFHDGLLFFYCRKRSWREDVAMEDFEEEPREFDLRHGFNAASESWEPRQEKSDFWNTYWSFWSSVRAYKKRELSYDSDALNAFAGIIDQVQVEKGMGTFWGLPLKTFVSDLFWQPDLFGAWRDSFPTWSWAGWTGGLASSRLGSEEHQFLSSWISVFRLKQVEAGSIQLCPVHVEKDINFKEIPEGSQEECLKSTLWHLDKLVLVRHQIREGIIKAENYCEIPDVRESINALTKLAHTRFDITQTLAAYSLDHNLQSQAIYFRALTTQVWISACAPNGQVVKPLRRVQWAPVANFRPTLYMYSTKESTLKPVGLAWIQTPVTYLKILEETSKAAPKEIRTDMKPGNTGGLMFRGDPRVWVPHMYRAAGNPQDQKALGDEEKGKALSDEQEKKAREIKQQLLAYAEEQQYPYDSIFALPSKPDELEEILRSRRILKLRIALISGPVDGDKGGRMGVPFGYPSHGRRFFRALILMDHFSKHPQHSEMMCFGQKIGVCELEIDTLPLLENIQFEDVVLV